MRHVLFTLVLCVSLGLLQGCLRAPVVPPIGVAFSEFNAPLDHDFDETAVSQRKGVSESISILGLVALGDASTAAAAKQGGLSRIDHADYEYYNVVGVYQRYRTVVYGK